MRDNDYILTFGWMTNLLGLKGNERETYAIIYSFSRDGESSFKGSLRYLADAVNVSTRAMQDILARLLERELIIKDCTMVNGVKMCSYSADLDKTPHEVPGYGRNFYGEEEISPGVWKNLPGGMEETSTNNTIDNTRYIYKRKENTVKESSSKRFVKPSIEEIEARIREMNYRVDAEVFYNYYESNGWKVGSNPMKDWRAALVTWEKKETNKKESYGTRTINTASARPRERVNHDWSHDRTDIQI